jgi:hypothetical protein
MTENIATLKSYAINLDIPLNLAAWWNANVSFTSTYNHYKFYHNQLWPNLTNGMIELLVYGNQNFILPKNYNISIGGYFISKFRSGYYTFMPQSSINAGISKALMDKNLNLSMNISDIFYGSVVNSVSNFNNINIHNIGKQESRIINFSASYRFGGKNVRQAKDKNSAQELQRIKSEH